MSRPLVERAPTVRLKRGDAMSPAMLPILALDLGTSASNAWGWAVLWDREHVATGLESTNGDETAGERMVHFRRWVTDMLSLARPALVVYGQPALADGPEPHNAEGVLLAEVQGRHDHVAPTSAEVKGHATGRPTARKAELVEAARARWGREQLTLPEAEALCLLAWAVDALSP